MLIHLGRGRRLVIVAEEPQERTRQVLREVNRRHGLLGGQLFFGLHHTAPPALDGGVKAGSATGHEEGLTATGAGAEETYLPAAIWQGIDKLPCPLGIAHDLVIRD